MEPHSRRCFSHNGTLLVPQALVLLLRTCLAGPTDHQVTHASADNSAARSPIKDTLARLTWLLNPFAGQGHWTRQTFVGMVELTALCGIASTLWVWSTQNSKAKEDASQALDDVNITDPGLLKKHSELRSYSIPIKGITYPAIRTFYRPHPQESKLPQKPSPVPLLVFIHGLGGSAAQFHPILISLCSLASCLAIDLPGCGRSSFEPKAWEAYTTEALVELLAAAIETYRDRDGGQKVVLIGHSMGCSLAALLASPTSPLSGLVSRHASGLIAICPKADPPDEKQSKALKTMASLPSFIFDLFRKWDRRGGINSSSVVRMTGAGAEEETKKLQLRFNRQSKTAVWQRMARGMIPGRKQAGLPGKEVWAGLDLPVFLAAGEADRVTPLDNVRRIVQFLGRDVSAIEPPSEKASLPIAAAPFDPARIDPRLDDRVHQDSGIDTKDLPNLDNGGTTVTLETSSQNLSVTNSGSEGVSAMDDSTTVMETSPMNSGVAATLGSPAPQPRHLVVKTTTIPKPASHSLLFAPSSSRILSGLISSFFSGHIDPRLSLGWQLQYLSTEGKWDVKNLKKWEAVAPVSLPIAGVFRAMKTLREVDEQHAPKIFVKSWASKNKDQEIVNGRDGLIAVVDISHDSPVYDPKGLEEGGISYYKFPTVSKQPPSVEEVQSFIHLVDKIRNEGKEGFIGVHCHYGFNRTGFFVVCYLVEKLRYRAEDAIEEFGQARPPGIRHSHFIDQLHVRYCTGLRKAPTL